MAYSDLILGHADLQSYWRLDDAGATAVDSGPAALNGTYINSPTVVSGLLDREDNDAHDFDAASEHWVDMGDIHDFAGTAAFTIEAWIEPGDAPSAFGARIVSKEDDPNVTPAGVGGYLLNWQEAAANIQMLRSSSDGNSDRAETPQNSAPAGERLHVVGVYDSSEMRIYINGSLAKFADNPKASTRSLAGNTNKLAIGCEVLPSGSKTNFFDGVIDDVAIYDAAISLSDIRDHYSEGRVIVRRRPRVRQRPGWQSMFRRLDRGLVAVGA